VHYIAGMTCRLLIKDDHGQIALSQLLVVQRQSRLFANGCYRPILLKSSLDDFLRRKHVTKD